MQGSLQPLVGMFSGDDTCLVIPVYQRNYDWRRANCERLFQDLVETVKNGKASHFFGSIVYKVEGGVGESTIIDGQQRLTTVNLLFLALHKALTSGLVPPDDRLTKRIEDGYLRSEYSSTGYKLKLKPVKADASAYTKLFNEHQEKDDSSTVTANYRYFLDRITQLEVSPQELFDAIRKLQVMRLQLDDADDAQLIFESLNSTGLDLSKADMVRNWVLMGHDPKTQKRLYEEYWNRIEEDVDYDTSEFLRQFLTTRLGRTPRIDDLYDEFKDWVKADGRPMEQVLTELRTFARHYRQLRTASTGQPDLDRLLSRYNLIDRSVTHPFLMLMMEGARRGDLTMGELFSTIQVTDTYLTRRWAQGLPTNTLNKTFALLHREANKLVGKGATWPEAVAYHLLHRTGSAAFPTDEEFLEALQTRDFYRIAPQQRNYFWESLENGHSKDVLLIAEPLARGDISIEHVMPQKLTADWRTELGPEHERIHATWLNRLGNLTVTGYNSSYSNSSFATKRDRPNGFKDTPYRLNNQLRDQTQWTEAEIECRGEDLAQRALALWPLPECTFVPPKPPEDIEALSDEGDFTGRSILSWELHGTEHPVTTWKEMLIGVLQTVAQLDSAGLHRIAPHTTDLRLRPDPDDQNPGWRTVSGDVQVWSSSSTSWKMTLLRRVFTALHLDPEELLFHMKPEADSDE
ncbi:DUF262 domain-containing protein [Luteococcus sp. Sow4_B9]|uniref:DUF262 domain-containing protein n=1 Tax=Luteococcus sp. Sow4_B9 TaxID=3438792 RepID=UPI003F98A499